MDAAGKRRQLAGRRVANLLSIHGGRRVGARGRGDRVAEGLEDRVAAICRAAREGFSRLADLDQVAARGSRWDNSLKALDVHELARRPAQPNDEAFTP